MMKTLIEKIEVMKAALDGKEIEFYNVLSQWVGFIDSDPLWQWDDYDYRIKLEPMEFWVNVYEDGDYFLHESRKIAESYEEVGVKKKTIKVREVTE